MKNNLKVSYAAITNTEDRSVLLFRRRGSAGATTAKWELPNAIRDDVTVSDQWLISSVLEHFPDSSLMDGLRSGIVSIKWMPFQSPEVNPALPAGVEIYPASIKLSDAFEIDHLNLETNPLYDMAFLMPIDSYDYLLSDVFGDKPFAKPITDSLLKLWYKDSTSAKISDWRQRALFARKSLTEKGIFYINDFQISYDDYMRQQAELVADKAGK